MKMEKRKINIFLWNLNIQELIITNEVKTQLFNNIVIVVQKWKGMAWWH